MGGRGFEEFPSLAGIHVLLVEDEPDARELLQVVIEYAEGMVTSAPSATAALEALETLRPDVVVIDIVMPGYDGYWLIDRMRGLPSGGAELPTVAVTGRTRIHDRARALRAGFHAYLAKPVDPLELCRLIRDLVRRGE